MRLLDIITDKQDTKEFHRLHVHLAKGDIISDGYSYQDNPLGHITHKNFQTSHVLDTHSMKHDAVTNYRDSWDTGTGFVDPPFVHH